DFPTTPGAFDTSYNGGADAFVTKLNATGTALLYSTYLGGGSDPYNHDAGRGIAVDGAGSAYVTGNTSAPDCPTTARPFDQSLNGYDDVFVTKLYPDGSALAYSTYLGGGYYDVGYGIAVDGAGSTYVTGYTFSPFSDPPGFPTTPGAFDRTWNGGYDAFVTKL